MCLWGRVLYFSLFVSMIGGCLFASDQSSPESLPKGLTQSTGTSPAVFSVPLSNGDDIPPFSLPGSTAPIELPESNDSKNNTFLQTSIHERVPTMSRSHTDSDLYEVSHALSRQPSPPPEPIDFQEEETLSRHSSICIQNESTTPTREQTPVPQTNQDKKVDDIDQHLLILALAYEGYQVKVNESFSPSYKHPEDFLNAIGYIKDKKTVSNHYSLIKNDAKKDAYFAFARTNASNMYIAIGSCFFWEPKEFDAVGQALLPSGFSYLTNKPFTALMYTAFSFCALSSFAAVTCWMKCYDIVIPGLVSCLSMSLSVVLWKNIVPWLIFPAYQKHVHTLVKEISPIYAKLKEDGYTISFVGHSLGGHFAQIFASLFKGSQAHSISSPGVGYLQLLFFHAWYKAWYSWEEENNQSIPDYQINILSKVRDELPDFDADEFLGKAKNAYLSIIKSFVQGRKGGLKQFVTPSVYDAFCQMIDNLKEQNLEQESEIVDFLSIDVEKSEIDESDMFDRKVCITLLLKTKQINVVYNDKGELIEKPAKISETVSDLWTFERSILSSEPIWLLSKMKRVS